MGGTSEEILQNSAIMQLFMPTIRADFALVDSYVRNLQTRKDGLEPVVVDIHYFGGMEDEISPSVQEHWKMFTTSRFTSKFYEGGHFYLLKHYKEIICEIKCITTQ